MELTVGKVSVRTESVEMRAAGASGDEVADEVARRRQRWPERGDAAGNDELYASNEAQGMMILVPKHWFSWDFRLMDPVGMPWGEIWLSSWRERGSVTVGDQKYKVRREGFTGPFVLDGPGGELARAVKVSAFKHEFLLTVGGRGYGLKRLSLWGRTYALLDGDRRLGSVTPEHWLTRRAQIDLPEELPGWARAFTVWLTLLMWKRDSDAGATAAGS